ncbi:MAG TPA: hypothetical protein VMM78_07165, partial [Thermomicrobiales bacterium]|nr:hypothetical protein [Thermomicrobiales bacterium]
SRIAGVGRVCNEPNPADCREPWQVYTVLADGSDLTFLAEDGYALTWSPDGTRLAFARGEDMDDLVVMNADGTDQAVIATVRGISSIAWSPDGERLAIMAQPGPYQIFVINADGSSILELASHDPNRLEVFPVWSPDGGSIAFTTLDGNDSELRVVNAEGWGEINLSGYSGVDGNPDW